MTAEIASHPYRSLRCLLLTPVVPFPPDVGGRIRTFNLARGLRDRGHHVDVLSLFGSGAATDDGVRQLERLGIGVSVVGQRRRVIPALGRALATRTSLYAALHRSSRYRAALLERLRAGNYDIVQCEYSFMAQYQMDDDHRWVFDAHNLEFELSTSLESLRTGREGPLYRLYSAYEGRYRRVEERERFRNADCVLTVSEVDRDRLNEEVAGVRTAVIPNGVDLEWYDPAWGAERSGRLLFVGAMNYRPNIDGVQWFCNRMLPTIRSRAADVELDIVGSDPVPAVRKLASDRVRVTGYVTDPRVYLREAAVVVVPLRAGSGTRLKILEALAMGKAVVTTSKGCEGIDVVDGRHVAIADDEGSFAAEVARLLADADAREALGRQGRELVERRYGWSATVDAMLGVYERLLEEAAP